MPTHFRSNRWYEMKYGLTEIVAAATVVSLPETRLWLRVHDDQTDDDTTITALIAAATGQVEDFLRRQLVTATWDMTVDTFPTDPFQTSNQGFGAFNMPKPPLQSVTTVKFLDENGVEQTMPDTDYVVDATSEVKGRIALATDASWPLTETTINAVTVRFIAGYGAAAAVPQEIKTALLMIVSDLYEHREAQMETTIKENRAVRNMLMLHAIREAA